MNVLFAFMLAFTNWLYVPADSPSSPVEIDNIDLNLKTDELAVTFLSLSDGEAILLQHGNGENILINTGGEGTENELKRLLELYHVDNISTVLLTSDDNQFTSNLPWIYKQYDVNQLIVGKTFSKEKLFNHFVDANTLFWVEGTKDQILPGVMTEVLFEGNEDSEGMDFTIKFHKHKLLIMTSTSNRAKDHLMAKSLSDVNIIKIPEFAHKHSINEKLLERVDPQLAIVFQSKKIQPSSDIFQLLHEAWINVYFTKKHGTVTIKFTETNYEAITIKKDADG